MKVGLAVIGAQEQNDQVQRFVALECHGKGLDAASSGLQRVIPYRGASAHAFLNHIILRPQQNLKPSGPAGIPGMASSFGIGPECVGVAEAENIYHRQNLLIAWLSCSNQ